MRQKDGRIERWRSVEEVLCVDLCSCTMLGSLCGDLVKDYRLFFALDYRYRLFLLLDILCAYEKGELCN